MSKHKAFILATGADTAGTAVRLAQAFQRDPAAGWNVHSMVSADNYIHYPIDLTYGLEALLRSYYEADVVQLNSTMHGHYWYDRGQGKPTVLVHHGIHSGHFDKDVYECVVEARELGAVQVGTTVNLELLAPLGDPSPSTVTWTPTPYDLPALAAYRKRLYEPSPTKLVRIGHAPTDRLVKSTATFLAAIKSLRSEGLPVEGVLIERQTFAATMERKARSVDVLVDQLKLGYGCNAIEAWAMGIPVIGGVKDPSWRAHMVARYLLAESPTGLPFYEATERTLADTIRQFVLSRDLREEWSAIGSAHVERHHSEGAVCKLVASIYSIALNYPTVPTEAPAPSAMTHEERRALLRANRARRLAARETSDALDHPSHV